MDALDALRKKLTGPRHHATPIFDQLFDQIDRDFDYWEADARERHWDMRLATTPQEATA